MSMIVQEHGIEPWSNNETAVIEALRDYAQHRMIPLYCAPNDRAAYEQRQAHLLRIADDLESGALTIS